MEYSIQDFPLVQKVELSQNDDVLSDQEKEHARIVLTDMEASLSHLDREISRLSAERERLGMRISKFHTALAPHKRLPAEVLAQIFVFAVGTKSIEFPPTFTQERWVLLRICSRWRKVALDEPRLWNRVLVDAGSIPMPQFLAFSRMLDNVLPSAGPLFITLRNPESVVLLSMTVIRSLVPRLPRVKELTLSVSNLSLFYLFPSPSDTLAALEFMHLDICDVRNFSELDPKFKDTPVFRNASRLRRLELSSSGSRMVLRAVSSLPFPWRQLTSIVIISEPIGLVDLYQVLRECGLLQTLRVRVGFESGEPLPPPCEELILPYLRHVEVQGEVLGKMASIPLPWRQLISLDLRYLIGDFAYGTENEDILLQCVQVEDLSILVDYNPVRLPTDYGITFTKLTHLHMELELNPIILEYFLVPALTSLSVEFTFYFGAFSAARLSDLITRSGCSLSRFIIHNRVLLYEHEEDFEELHHFFLHISSVKELELNHLILDECCVQLILGDGAFSHLEYVSFILKRGNVVKFVDALEVRAKAEAAGEDGVILCRVEVSVRGASHDWLHSQNCRLDRLNIEYGTRFQLNLHHFAFERMVSHGAARSR